jgi:hypothetical protein
MKAPDERIVLIAVLIECLGLALRGAADNVHSFGRLCTVLMKQDREISIPDVRDEINNECTANGRSIWPHL